MRIVVQRTMFSDKSAIGQLMIDGRFFCYTLEDVDRYLEEDGSEKIAKETAIPRGLYPILITHSRHFNMDLPLLCDVKGFRGVRIHSGNTDEHTEGCILVGSDFTDDFVCNSRSTFAKLFNKINDALNKHEDVTLEVT